MKTFVVIAVILMGAYIIKMLIDINLLVLKFAKSKKIRNEKNKLDKDYEFIKGLY